MGAHPRSRGEHKGNHNHDPHGGGSSPLARGTRGVFEIEDLEVGLIPARAGNTQYRAGPAAPGRAHPRSRGEHPYSPLRVFLMMGSSPLARGTHVV